MLLYISLQQLFNAGVNCSMKPSTIAIELCGPGIGIVVATAIGNADKEDIACVTS